MKVLFIDIETSPNLCWTFELKRAYIGIEAIVEPSRMLCFAATWLDNPSAMHFYSEWQHGHEGMLAAAYQLLSEADVVVHYNGERFDEPRMNQEFAQMGWAPPAPFQRIDIWKTVSRRFSLPSQKLDYVLTHFGLGGKQSTGGMRLWVGVMNNDDASRRKMEDYNRNDVAIMVPLYSKLRPWIVGHPNVGLYAIDGEARGDEHRCPTCDSTEVQKRGTQKTDASEYQRYRCNKCGRWSRESRRIRGAGLRAVAA